MRRAACLIVLAACGRFQDPNTVVDLRVLAMTAEPPDQLVTVDLSNPDPNAVLAQLVPTKMCALVTDPNFTRRLRWTMTACGIDSSGGRCTTPEYTVYPDDGSCTQAPCFIDDLDVTMPEPKLCVTVPADSNLLGVLLPIAEGDPFHGLGGIDWGVQLVVGGEGADPALDLYASKQAVVSPHIPDSRSANHNPFLTAGEPLDASVDSGTFLPLPMGRCADQSAAGGTQLVVAPGDVVRLAPIEPPGIHETYSVPALDGTIQTFTEAITYDWQATAGSFSNGDTGGGRDEFGEYPPIYTDWTAPDAMSLTGPLDVHLWIVQRDERMGEAWYETCIHVQP